MNWLSIHQLSKQFGVKKVLSEVTFGMEQGQKIGLVGANGSGKSTLFKIIMGLETPDSGTVHRNKSISFASLSQEPGLTDSNTVFQEVLEERIEELSLLEDYHLLSTNLTDANNSKIEELERLQDRLETLDCWDLENKVKQYLNQVGITDLQRRIGDLSGGEKKKIALAKVFINKAEFLLLDEPTNHLDTQTIEWLEIMLKEFKGSLILITHDRYFLTHVTDTIADLRKGCLKVYPGNYHRYLESVSHEQEVDYRTQKNTLSYLRRELQWVQKMPRARGTKSRSRLQSFDKAKDGVSEAQALNIKPLEEFQFGLHRRLGNTILEWGQLGKKFDQWLFRNSTHKILNEEKIGIIGRNGSGKSTFIKVFLGELKADEGWIEKGIHTEFCYFDQARLALKDEETVLESLKELGEVIQLEKQRFHIHAYLERFHFPRESFKKKVKLLSGGEKARLLLAKLVASKGNFLVLDEPTNDLDLDTLRILEEAICAYKGCAFIISHDRYFLDRTCNAILEVGVEETPFYSTGNYSYFRQVKANREEKRSEEIIEKPQTQSKPKARKQAFGYKESRELENLEPAISELEETIAELESKLESPLEPDAYKPLGDALEAQKINLEKAYQRWETLEALKELQKSKT
jgi:ABC transport system ATP-binding/permease protein